MSERSAKMFGVGLLVGVGALMYWAGPLGLLVGIFAAWIICECLKECGALPPRDPV